MDVHGHPDARWLEAAGRHRLVSAAAAGAWIECVLRDLRPSEGLVLTESIVQYKTARALQVAAETDLIALMKSAAAT